MFSLIRNHTEFALFTMILITSHEREILFHKHYYDVNEICPAD
ncbi:hypothetical protein BSLA_02r1884 [Burkholderia stabilis]|nr:hypothetical protein BSLA_02r1884 [Burkholderia stabilis]